MTLDRITPDLTKNLSKDDLRALADLENHEGWKVLYDITENYVRGRVVDEVLGNETGDPASLVMKARGVAQGARWVIDQVKKAKKMLVDEKKTE